MKTDFVFFKNRNTFLETGAIETTNIKLFKSYVLKNINKTTNNKQEEQEELDYFDRMEQIKKEAEMDNKPFYEINPSY